MLHIKLIIPQVFKKPQDIDKETVCKQAERIIKKSTPDIEVLFYKNKILFLKCFNSTTANELYLNQEKIKNKINQSLGRNIIKKLIIKTK